jgi:phosphonate transport system permease protein
METQRRADDAGRVRVIEPTETTSQIPIPGRTEGRRRPQRQQSAAVAGFLAFFLGLGGWSLVELGINIPTLMRGYSNAVGFIQRIWPPELPGAGQILQQSGFTLATVLLATLLSVVISLPLAVWAAANTTRGVPFRISSRGLIVAARAIPDIVLAILFVRLFGLGVLPGALAMGLHSVGMVGKLYADAIEQTAEEPREALRTVGATRRQQLVTGILPQALPAFIAVGLHRFDINLRHSAILGFVGVTGIGFEMSKAFGALQFSLGITWALILLLLCLLTELLSTTIRRALLHDSEVFERYNRHTLVGFLQRRRRTAHTDSTARTAQETRPTDSQSATTDPPIEPPGPVDVSADRAVSPEWTFARARRLLYAALFAAAVLWSLTGSGVLDSTLSGGLTGFLTTLGLFWPPGSAGFTEELVQALVVTVQIGFASALIGAMLAIPVGSLAARNVSGHRGLHVFFRGFVLLVRGLPELVVAILFVVVIGLGPVAGALALAIGSVGLLGKLVADSLEEIDPGPLEALKTIGASRTQLYFTAVLPQAARAIIGATLYQLDVNIRSATLLGLVGGGGIGFYLLQASHTREYEVITLIVLMTFAVVFALELFAMLLRRLLR